MVDGEVEILRGYELRLIRCTVSLPQLDVPLKSHSGTHPHETLISSLLSSIEAGDYLGALASDATKLIIGDSEFELVDTVDSAERFYSELLDKVESFVVNDSSDEIDKARRAVLVMCLAIASAFWFTCCNLTGSTEGSAKCSLPFRVSESQDLVEWENWAKIQLMSVGSDLLGKFSNLQHLVFARLLLLKLKDLLFATTATENFEVRSISWWLVRVLLIHQRVLHEQSSSLFEMLQVYMAEALDHYGALEKVKSYWATELLEDEALSITSTIHLEACVLQYIYGRIDPSRLQLESAKSAAGIEFSVSGALGFRTIHQVDPKAQMVLIANTSSSNGDVRLASEKADVGPYEAWGGEAPEVYMTPKLVNNESEAGKESVPLKPVEQALILAQCLLIERGSRHDEMQRWDMAPYIEAIDSQKSTYFVLRCFCDLLRVRWESTRGRTKGRALEMMDKLVGAINKSDPGVSNRIALCYAVHLPTIPALRKEYGELLVSCGLVGEAITIFESLELWDNLIQCYCLLGKKSAAVDLINARLLERPNDPRLWCSLGDVTINDSCYEKALEVSNDKSVRAKRGLARSAYNRGDFEKSKMLWEAAMALNSLYPDGWFALGAAALKARDVQKALDAFTFAVQLDPDNGEAWNNIACLHMIKKRSKESFIAFKEALKFKRDSWQMWENFSHVAMDVGNIDQAFEAIQQILKMSNNKRIDVVLLYRIMTELENRNLACKSSPSSSTEIEGSSDEFTETKPCAATPAETQRHLELLGKIIQQILDKVESFVVNDSSDEIDKTRRAVLVMCLAIASTLWFTRCNLTGSTEGTTKCSVPFKVSETKELLEWENWAKIQLMSAGSDLLGKFSNLQHLVFARMLLLKLKDLLFATTATESFEVRSISWWLVRVLLIHQRVLHEQSSSLFEMLQVYMAEALDHFGALEKVKSYWSTKLLEDEASSITSTIHLEACVLQFIYGRIDPSRLQLESAKSAAGIEFSVTGALGFRTIHQIDAKAQMVLVAKTSSSNGDVRLASEKADVGPYEAWEIEPPAVYMTPNFANNESEAGKDSVPLKPIEQALILAQCLLIERGSRHDEMQGWDMAPYIEAIDAQKSTYFALRCFCDLLRVRWESTRNRTKGRALEIMDKLVGAINKSDPGVANRIPLCYAVLLPTIPALRKEYGELLVSCGLVGEAITIFESLELWDNMIFCYCLLKKRSAAVDLINARLRERPNDPRLWCSLGDVTFKDSCYEKALEVSNDKSVRAKRALARSPYSRGDFEKSKILWEAAMAVNSLFPNGWFNLGEAAIKVPDVEKALDAFTFAVQLDPDNWKAWNNIACLLKMKGKIKESFIAYKEVLKLNRDNWKLWENFSHVAMDVGNTDQAFEAMQQLMRLIKNKWIDAVLLDRMMTELESRNLSCKSSMSLTEIDASTKTEQLYIELFGTIIQQIVKVESTPENWELYARWSRIKGNLTVCSEALLKLVRSYQGSEVWKDKKHFKNFARASLELCRVYMEISVSTGSKRELLSAEMHLKSTIKQATESFSDTEELKELESCLEEVRKVIQKKSEEETRHTKA